MTRNRGTRCAAWIEGTDSVRNIRGLYASVSSMTPLGGMLPMPLPMSVMAEERRAALGSVIFRRAH